jgi:ribosomal protein S18 acetylase RimI-like enzyme
MALDLDAIRRGAEAPIAADLSNVDQSADDLCAAFVDDPMVSWFMREDEKRHAARKRFFRVLLRQSAIRTGVIERPAAGGAAAIWVPSESIAPQSLIQELRALPMLLNASGLGRFKRLVALREAMDKHHPEDRPHDYLWFLGVHPEAQGAGIGSRLLASKTRRLDEAGRAGWLETATPKNVPLYRRHGFEIQCEYKPAEDGPLIWGMWRDPR